MAPSRQELRLEGLFLGVNTGDFVVLSTIGLDCKEKQICLETLLSAMGGLCLAE